jgi:hypothetical protein
MTSSRVLVAIVALATVVLAACGSRSSAQPVAHAATFDGPIKTAVRYDNSGISLTVPTSAATKSWSDAYATCLSGAAICDANSAPTITLANATVDRSGTVPSFRW